MAFSCAAPLVRQANVPILGRYARRPLAGAALCYSVYRLFFALGSFMPDPWIEPMFVAHRLVSVVVVAVVCGCFLGAARRMQALP